MKHLTNARRGRMQWAAVLLGGIVLTGWAGMAAAGAIYWTDWTSATIGKTDGSASGTINTPGGPIGVSYSGEVTGETNTTNTYPSWMPAGSFSGGDVSDAPPTGDIIAQNGGAGTGTNTITFSEAISNPVMAIWSLGDPGTQTEYVFPSNEVVHIEGGGPSYEYGGSSIYLVTDTNAITGNEGNGVIEFIGSYKTITFTNPIYENWYGFTLGVQGIAPPSTSVPEPDTFALLGAGVVALGWAGSRRRRRRLARS